MESIRWLLAVAGVEVCADTLLTPVLLQVKVLSCNENFTHLQFEEVHLTTNEQYQKLVDGMYTALINIPSNILFHAATLNVTAIRKLKFFYFYFY